MSPVSFLLSSRAAKGFVYFTIIKMANLQIGGGVSVENILFAAIMVWLRSTLFRTLKCATQEQLHKSDAVGLII